MVLIGFSCWGGWVSLLGAQPMFSLSLCSKGEWLGGSRGTLLAWTLIRSGTRLAMINAAMMNGNANVHEVAPAAMAQYH